MKCIKLNTYNRSIQSLSRKFYKFQDQPEKTMCNIRINVKRKRVIRDRIKIINDDLSVGTVACVTVVLDRRWYGLNDCGVTMWVKGVRAHVSEWERAMSSRQCGHDGEGIQVSK